MKLIIDIDKDAYEEIKKIVANKNEMCFMQKSIANGTPLDDIRLALIKSDVFVENDYDRGRNYGLHIARQIINKHIGVNNDGKSDI